MNPTHVSLSFDRNDLCEHEHCLLSLSSFNHADDDAEADADDDNKSCDETTKPAITKRPDRCETIRIVSD